MCSWGCAVSVSPRDRCRIKEARSSYSHSSIHRFSSLSDWNTLQPRQCNSLPSYSSCLGSQWQCLFHLRLGHPTLYPLQTRRSASPVSQTATSSLGVAERQIQSSRTNEDEQFPSTRCELDYPLPTHAKLIDHFGMVAAALLQSVMGKHRSWKLMGYWTAAAVVLFQSLIWNAKLIGI